MEHDMIRIESRDNAQIKRMTRLMSDRRFRKTNGEMACEGSKMLEEALRSGRQVSVVLLADGAAVSQELLEQAEQQGAKLYSCPEALLAKVSDVKTPQGIIFSCTRPVTDLTALQGAEKLLILEGLQDPGNLGTILRTADAFALDGIILCEGCVDPTAPKVVRATMGAAFRLPIASASLKEAAAFVRGQGMKLYTTALHRDSVSLTQTDLHKAAVIIGSEGRGVSQTAIDVCDQCVIIPMKGYAESLKASLAASIVMYEMQRS